MSVDRQFRNQISGSGAWLAWTPTLTAASGTITTKSGTGRFVMIGKTVHYSAILTITTVGTGSGSLNFSLPVAAHASSGNLGSGRETAATGAALSVTYLGGVGVIVRYDNATVLASGRTCNVSGSYEAA